MHTSRLSKMTMQCHAGHILMCLYITPCNWRHLVPFFLALSRYNPSDAYEYILENPRS